MLELNKIYNEDCLTTMANLEDNCIDATICSPPYDNVRKYSDYPFNFGPIAKELTRILKPGRVIVWVVNDQYIDGGRSLTSFKQCIYFKEQCNLTVHDVMIYQKSGFNFPVNNRYHQTYEFMLILSKGKPKTFNPIMDRKNIYPGQKAHGKHRGYDENDFKDMSSIINRKPADEYGKRFNIWYYKVGGGHVTKDKIAYSHPAIFPEELVKDHLTTWTNPGDLVFDPFMGSGTTAKMCKLMNRNFIGSEISAEYCSIAQQRLDLLDVLH